MFLLHAPHIFSQSENLREKAQDGVSGGEEQVLAVVLGRGMFQAQGGLVLGRQGQMTGRGLGLRCGP